MTAPSTFPHPLAQPITSHPVSLHLHSLLSNLNIYNIIIFIIRVVLVMLGMIRKMVYCIDLRQGLQNRKKNTCILIRFVIVIVRHHQVGVSTYVEKQREAGGHHSGLVSHVYDI